MKRLTRAFGIAICTMIFAFALSLAGCGGNAAQSDEDLIKADIDSVIGTSVSTEELVSELKNDSELASYASYGLDLDAVSQSLTKLYKVEIKEVEVNGDKAVARLAATVPSFGDALDAILEEEIEKIDVSQVTEEDQVMGLVADILNDVFTRSDYPTATQEFTVDYVKKDGKWQIEDPDAVNEALREIMGLA